MENAKLSLFVEYTILYGESPKELTKELLRQINSAKLKNIRSICKIQL